MSETNLAQPIQKSSFKFLLFFIVLGILISVTCVSLAAPKMIAWYFEPPMSIGISCESSIKWAVTRILMAQLYSVGFGAIIGLMIGLKFRKA